MFFYLLLYFLHRKKNKTVILYYHIDILFAILKCDKDDILPMKYARLLSDALTIGEKMLCSGAEVSRVEDSITRICSAYGADRVDVFTITSSIVVSADFEGKTYTQTRRIKSYRTDFDMLDRLNNLSRYICAKCPDEEYVEARLSEILGKKDYPKSLQTLAWALTAGSFTVFFGGSVFEGVISAIIGVLLFLCVVFVDGRGINKVFSNLFSSFVVTMLAVLFVKLGFGQSCDKIIIGNIMLLIPGLALTNSLRDLIGGDIMSGVLRFCEACLVAVGIAGGYFAASFVLGGAVL